MKSSISKFLLARSDVYDRYIVRLREMEWSNAIVEQALERLPKGPILSDNPWVALPPKDNVLKDIDALIRQFKIASEGFQPPRGEVYVSVEPLRGVGILSRERWIESAFKNEDSATLFPQS